MNTPTPSPHTPTLPLHWDGIAWSKVRDCTGALLFDAGTPEKAREFVRACNAYDTDQARIAALVAALERTLNQLDSLARATVETQTGLIDPRKSPAYAESRAALAGAKE